MLSSEVAVTDAEKEREARCKEMLNQLIAVVKKQTLEIEELAESMKELAVGLKAVAQPPGATAHASSPPVTVPTATLAAAADHAVAAATPRAEAALTPESPTRCSMIRAGDDIALQTSAFMPDAAPGPPPNTTLLDITIASPGPTVTAVRVCDSTSDLAAHQQLKEMPLTPPITVVLDVGSGVTKTHGDIALDSYMTTMRKMDKPQPWPPPKRMETTGVGAESRSAPGPMFIYNGSGVQLKQPPVPRCIVGRVEVIEECLTAADAGLSLADVAAEAKHASELVGTMGVALSVCTLPGQVTSDRLGPKQMELGLGIHGEPGVAVVELQPVDVVVEHVLKQILSQETHYLPSTRGSNAVLLINGLGATPIMELMIAARKAVPELQLEYGIAVDRVYTGTFMSSLDMAGFSTTIMRSDENILQRLDAPTKALAWPVGSEGNRPPAKIPVPVPPSPSMRDDEILSQPQVLSKQGCVTRGCVPKKILFYGASFQGEFEDSKNFGWEINGDINLNWKKLLENKTQEIVRLNGVYQRILANSFVNMIEGACSLVDAHTVEVTQPDGSKQKYMAQHILIATGSRAQRVNIPRKELAITSDEALSLEELPKRAVILGGGYIAVIQVGDTPNPYEQAISIIGRTLSRFHDDNLVPCFGFGNATTHDQSVFSLYPDNRPCDGFEQALDHYREIVPQPCLAGPTSYAPMIETTIGIVDSSGGQCHVLLIIADGQVTCSVDTGNGQLSPHERETIDAIMKASDYPLSIVLVGVGDGPWDMMRQFDDNIPSRACDKFQFVNFTEIMARPIPKSKKEAEFALLAVDVANCALGDPLRYQITDIDGKVSMAQIRRVSGFIEKLQMWTLDCKVEQSWNHKLNIQLPSVYNRGPYFIHWDKIVMHDLFSNIYGYELMGQGLERFFGALSAHMWPGMILKYGFAAASEDLFHGVSNSFIAELVMKMPTDYFAPKEDIILQKERAADSCVIVSRVVNMLTTVNGNEQVYMKVAEGDMFGKGLVTLFGLSNKRTIKILKDVSGILKPSRLTLLLGPPSSGKSTLMRALTGKHDKNLKVSGKVTYCGHTFSEFYSERTSAYVSQYDLHNPEMTVRETLDFSRRCLGIGARYDMLSELARREQNADLILKVLGIDICADIIVGGEMKRGISGGQKKRVTTGEMLTGPATALFIVSAWGQAEIQGGGNVTERPILHWALSVGREPRRPDRGITSGLQIANNRDTEGDRTTARQRRLSFFPTVFSSSLMFPFSPIPLLRTPKL